jgi:hypothetical protein
MLFRIQLFWDNVVALVEHIRQRYFIKGPVIFQILHKTCFPVWSNSWNTESFFPVKLQNIDVKHFTELFVKSRCGFHLLSGKFRYNHAVRGRLNHFLQSDLRLYGFVLFSPSLAGMFSALKIAIRIITLSMQ